MLLGIVVDVYEKQKIAIKRLKVLNWPATTGFADSVDRYFDIKRTPLYKYKNYLLPTVLLKDI